MEQILKTALALYMNDGTKVTEIEDQNWDHWGLKSFIINGEEWAIGTDDEAEEATKEYIKETAWAFNSSFIIENSSLPYEAAEMIQNFQESKCEGANETILALIDDIDDFVQSAIRADGRGHFLSGYDGVENQINIKYKSKDYTFYIYRTN
jgi:hypothetical protein